MSDVERSSPIAARSHARTLVRPPVFMPLDGTITAAQVEAECPGEHPIFVCDFYVEGAEGGTLEAGGLRLGRILNVDHHAPVPRMEQEVTSTALAAAYVREHGVQGARDRWVAINHTDCDSILSSAIMLGYLPPEERFVEASICADHTGDVNDIADVLQSLDQGRRGNRTEAHYLESLASLQCIVTRQPLPPAATLALQRQAERRAAADALVASGRMRVERGVAFAQADSEIDGAFFPALVPDASLIVLACPHDRDARRFTVKVRRGLGAPTGLTLHALGITAWDANYGGRWNAGSNKRAGGTSMSPHEYADRLRERLTAVNVRGHAEGQG